MRVFLYSLFVASIAFGYPLTPDQSETSGETCTTSDPDFAEYRYPEKIPYCERNVATPLKKKIYREYGISSAEQSQYTIDHLIPLSLGGSNHEINLWPEHKDVKALRPTLEYQLYLQIRDGKITQAKAIDTILYAKFHPKGRAGETCEEGDLLEQ